MTATIWKTVP